VHFPARAQNDEHFIDEMMRDRGDKAVRGADSCFVEIQVTVLMEKISDKQHSMKLIQSSPSNGGKIRRKKKMSPWGRRSHEALKSIPPLI
jgi:hypothetical protein